MSHLTFRSSRYTDAGDCTPTHATDVLIDEVEGVVVENDRTRGMKSGLESFGSTSARKTFEVILPNGCEPMSDVGAFGELLQHHRIAAGFSQEELANRARISVETIGALERGVRRAPYPPTVAQLRHALELSDKDGAMFETAAARARARKRGGRNVIEADQPANNLPSNLSSFVGRDDDLAKLAEALDDSRLVTITGSGGVGKTRTAIEIGKHVLRTKPCEVWFIDLSSINSGELIAGKVALSIQPPLAGRFESVQSLAVSLTQRRALLIFDNCEHLTTYAADAVKELLETCPGISILSTSRERLNIIGESIYRLPSLSLPDKTPIDLDRTKSYGAIALFIERTQTIAPSVLAVDPRLEIVVDICRRLDGIPFAIELAAARVPLLGIATLRDRLAASLSFAFQGHALPARQQTMLATITWSYELLNEAERVLLRRLAVFTGGFTLEAVEAVCAAFPLETAAILESLSSLVEKSLVTVVHSEASVRYYLLESLRTFGLDKLAEAGEGEAIALSHATWVTALAESVRPSNLAELSKAEALTPELDNVRSALQWCKNASSPDERALAAKIFLGMQGLWTLSGRHAEMETLAADALANIDEDEQPLDAALLIGILVSRSWMRPGLRPLVDRAIPAFERVGRPSLLAQCFSMLTYVYAMLGDIPEAEHAAERAIAFATSEGMLETLAHADILANRAKLRLAQQRLDDARADLTTAAAIAERLGNRFYVVAMCLPRLAEVESRAGNLRKAIALAEEMLSSDIGSVQHMATLEALGFLACLRLQLGDLDAAETASRRQLELAHGDETMAIEYLATVAALRGDANRAARLQGFVGVLLTQVPIGLYHQRTENLLSASLNKQQSPEALSAQRAIGARYTLAQATAEALNIR